MRALVRDPDSAKLPAGVALVRGDLTDAASLHEALRGVDAVFLVWPFLTADGAADVLDVIRAHARRVVYLSAAGVDPDRDDQGNPILAFHADLERTIERSGLEWVFLRPCSFANNNLAWADQVRAGEALTTAEQAVAIGEALDLPVRFEELPLAEARAQAIAAGYPDDLVEALFDGSPDLAAQPVTRTVEEITGRTPLSIRQWARDHADAFR